MRNLDPQHDDHQATSVLDDQQCVGCGYPLRGLQRDANCPECGCPVDESTLQDESEGATDQSIQIGMRYLAAGWFVLLLMVFSCFSHTVMMVVMLVAVGFRLYGLSRLRTIDGSITGGSSGSPRDTTRLLRNLARVGLAMLVLYLVTNRIVLQLGPTNAFSLPHLWVWAIIWFVTALEANAWLTWLKDQSRSRAFPKLGTLILISRAICLVPLCILPAVLIAFGTGSLLTGLTITGIGSMAVLGFFCWAATAIFKDLHHQTIEHSWDLGNKDEDLKTRMEWRESTPAAIETADEIPLAEIPLAESDEPREPDSD